MYNLNKLETTQTKAKLNDVYEVKKGTDHHNYVITKHDEETTKDNIIAEIGFQDGPRAEENSLHGVIDSDLLEIVKDRLKFFQDGPYNSVHTETALYHVNKALDALNDRVEDRLKRNVLGKYEK